MYLGITVPSRSIKITTTIFIIITSFSYHFYSHI